MNDEVKIIGALLGGIAVLALAIAIPSMLYYGYKLKKLAESSAPLELACATADAGRFESPCIILMNRAAK